jgi:hypothetical protein
MTNMQKKTIGLADRAKLGPIDKSDEIDPIAGRFSTLIGGIAMALGNLA